MLQLEVYVKLKMFFPILISSSNYSCYLKFHFFVLFDRRVELLIIGVPLLLSPFWSVTVSRTVIISLGIP